MKRASSSSIARLHTREIAARLRRAANHELPADLPEINVCVHVGGDLLVIDEPLVEPGRLPAASTSVTRSR